MPSASADGRTRRLGFVDVVLFGPAAVWIVAAVLGSIVAVTDDAAWTAPDRHGAPVVGADGCRSCHAQAWSTWHASYHRTMTQPTPRGVLAPFAGERIGALGFLAEMTRGDDGRPRMRITDERGAVVVDGVVELAVGSHRIQQYVARIDRGGGPGELWRLPMAWHIAEARWIHLNGAFLAPDGEDGSTEDLLRHLSRYNDNCLFCHNTEPVPGLQDDGTFESSVGQWGIACEACHGPGSFHVARQDAMLRRVWSAIADDRSITHPGHIAGARADDICGRCHGQRIGHDIAAILEHGDGFVPGEPLDRVSRPILRDSQVGDDGPSFAARFWPDGTARLSAHEYQAHLSSPCDGLGCGTCHDMHGNEPSMQLRAQWDPVKTCTGCHTDLDASIPNARLHGGHTGATTCTDCHMPRTTYGLLGDMISHRISSPDPAASIGRHDEPDACTQCHVDRSRGWAAAAMPALGLRSSNVRAVPEPDEAWASRVVLDLHGGDPIQRALAAAALAQDEPPVAVRQRLAWLVDGLVDDYPAVRWIAWRGSKSLAAELEATDDEPLVHALAAFDPAAPLEQRLAHWDALRRRLGPGVFDDHPERRELLETRRDATAIWIGE